MPRKTNDNPLGLEAFDGSAVTKAGIEISNAGGGLHEALDVDTALAVNVAKTMIGDTRYVLLRCDCTKVRYQPVPKNEDQMKRVAIFRCTDATMVEGEFAVDAINAQRDTIRAAQEKASGQLTMDGSGGADGDDDEHLASVTGIDQGEAFE